ncbi:MAG TPA: alpha/beta fold hydrolase [Myxococcales bacterium]|nr:alpha/beta fold hydrolase [Myxococcales bacterium]
MRANGAELYVEDTGTGPAVVFSHGLLWSTALWRFQVAAFRERYRCITYDHRGQGKSEVTASGYDMDTLTEDAAALIDQLGAAPAHFVGLSMGGFVGMRLAARRPELVRSLALVETASDEEPLLNRPRYAAMAAMAQVVGMRPFVPKVMSIMFGRSFLNDPGRAALREGLVEELVANDASGTRRAVGGVIWRRPVPAAELARIRAPTLVISGEEDAAVTSARSRRTAERIAGAKFVSLPRAGHSSSLEEPDALNRALEAFWKSL